MDMDNLPHDELFTKRNFAVHELAGEKKMKIADLKQPLVLLRCRELSRMPGGGRLRADYYGEKPGILLWITKGK